MCSSSELEWYIFCQTETPEYNHHHMLENTIDQRRVFFLQMLNIERSQNNILPVSLFYF